MPWERLSPSEQGAADRIVEGPARHTVPGERIEAVMIGPIRLLIGRDGPAQRAGAGHGPLMGLTAALAPPHTHPHQPLLALQRHLKLWGARTWGRGYAPRSAFTAALQARHTVVRHGTRPDPQLDGITEILLGKDPKWWRARAADALLTPSWDDLPRRDEEVSNLLFAAIKLLRPGRRGPGPRSRRGAGRRVR